jgi:hypothetical protein
MLRLPTLWSTIFACPVTDTTPGTDRAASLERLKYTVCPKLKLTGTGLNISSPRRNRLQSPRHRDRGWVGQAAPSFNEVYFRGGWAFQRVPRGA